MGLVPVYMFQSIITRFLSSRDCLVRNMHQIQIACLVRKVVETAGRMVGCPSFPKLSMAYFYHLNIKILLLCKLINLSKY